jgi:hypothetical protein
LALRASGPITARREQSGVSPSGVGPVHATSSREGLSPNTPVKWALRIEPPTSRSRHRGRLATQRAADPSRMSLHAGTPTHQPYAEWEDRGIVVRDTNKRGERTRSVRNAIQTRCAMADALVSRVVTDAPRPAATSVAA